MTSYSRIPATSLNKFYKKRSPEISEERFFLFGFNSSLLCLKAEKEKQVARKSRDLFLYMGDYCSKVSATSLSRSIMGRC